MDLCPPALPHGPLEEVFPDVFFVTGMMKMVLMGAPWQFSRNMTVVRDGNALSLINSVRLDDAGLAELDALGRVTNVIKIGSFHGRDDAFYQARYGAKFWAIPHMENRPDDLPGLAADLVRREIEPVADREIRPGGEMPFAGCSVFAFRTTKLPECILQIDRAGGILVTCDSLQNWTEPDKFFSPETRQIMTDMGFFQHANLGPVWMQVSEPQQQDFARLRELPFQHALCGHGAPLRDTAKEAYVATFQRIFGI